MPINTTEPFTVPEFACWIASLTKSRLKGLFLEKGEESPIEDLNPIDGMPNQGPVISANLFHHKVLTTRSADFEKLFEEACDRRGVRSILHLVTGLPKEEVIHESRFADLLIVDPAEKFEASDRSLPSHFVEYLLEKSECPVILSPSNFDGIEEVIFAYDGTHSSVFAIKQFTYLLPELSDKRVVVLEAQDNNATITDRNKLAELLQPRYSKVGFKSVPGKADDVLLDYLLGRTNVLLVMGSYGRSTISRFFHKSTSTKLIRTFNIPVFIAHR